MTVLKYKNIDPSKIKILKPVKSGGVYSSEIVYGDDSAQLIVQTPEVKITGNKTLEFKLARKGQFFTVLEDISNKIADIIYVNSKTFFNGKEFSEQRIKKSLTKITEVLDSGIAIVKNVNVLPSAKYYNEEKTELKDVALPLEGTCIIRISRVVFDKKSIDIPVEISHIKVTPVKKKILDCILEDSEEEGEADPVVASTIEEATEVKETVPETEPAPAPVEETPVAESASEEPAELNTVVKDFDNLEFFED